MLAALLDRADDTKSIARGRGQALALDQSQLSPCALVARHRAARADLTRRTGERLWQGTLGDPRAIHFQTRCAQCQI